jgi:hypothetical protein
MPRGGKRLGAGRPPTSTGRAKHCIYCTQKELELVRKYLQDVRLKEELNKNGSKSI